MKSKKRRKEHWNVILLTKNHTQNGMKKRWIESDEVETIELKNKNRKEKNKNKIKSKTNRSENKRKSGKEIAKTETENIIIYYCRGNRRYQKMCLFKNRKRAEVLASTQDAEYIFFVFWKCIHMNGKVYTYYYIFNIQSHSTQLTMTTVNEKLFVHAYGSDCIWYDDEDTKKWKYAMVILSILF